MALMLIKWKNKELCDNTFDANFLNHYGATFLALDFELFKRWFTHFPSSIQIRVYCFLVSRTSRNKCDKLLLQTLLQKKMTCKDFKVKFYHLGDLWWTFIFEYVWNEPSLMVLLSDLIRVFPNPIRDDNDCLLLRMIFRKCLCKQYSHRTKMAAFYSSFSYAKI